MVKASIKIILFFSFKLFIFFPKKIILGNIMFIIWIVVYKIALLSKGNQNVIKLKF